MRWQAMFEPGDLVVQRTLGRKVQAVQGIRRGSRAAKALCAQLHGAPLPWLNVIPRVGASFLGIEAVFIRRLRGGTTCRRAWSNRSRAAFPTARPPHFCPTRLAPTACPSSRLSFDDVSLFVWALAIVISLVRRQRLNVKSRVCGRGTCGHVYAASGDCGLGFHDLANCSAWCSRWLTLLRHGGNNRLSCTTLVLEREAQVE